MRRPRGAASPTACASIGWRLDPHGVTASGAFSASSIEDWQRAIEQWLEPARSDNRVLIATSILLDGRIVYGPKRDLDVKQLALRDRVDRADAGALDAAAGAGREAAHGLHARHRRRGLRRAKGDLRHQARWADADRRPGPLRRAAGRRPRHAHRRAPAGSRPARACSGAPRRGSSRRRSSSSARSGSSTRSSSSSRASEPDDRIDPKQLDPLTRRYLRDAFREVAAVQRSLTGDLSPR